MELDAGQRLRALRAMYGLSQRSLAKKAGVTNGIISMIEQNRNSPSLATLKKILDAFPISFSEFFPDGTTRLLQSDQVSDNTIQPLTVLRSVLNAHEPGQWQNHAGYFLGNAVGPAPIVGLSSVCAKT